MTHPDALHHSLLRPCVLHILRAAGYHATKASVLDTLTDLAARYISVLAVTSAAHATVHDTNPELALEISIQDVRMALQDCGALLPSLAEEMEVEGVEDTRGVDAFLSWATGPVNKEIRRVALDGNDGVTDDYLTILKKKHSATGDEESRYIGTVLGKAAEPRVVKVEGGDLTSLREWEDKLKGPPAASTLASSRRQSSVLSSLGDATMESMEF